LHRPLSERDDTAGKCQRPIGVGHDAGPAETTAAIALMVGITVMMCPSTMKSAIVSALEAGGGRN